MYIYMICLFIYILLYAMILCILYHFGYALTCICNVFVCIYLYSLASIDSFNSMRFQPFAKPLRQAYSHPRDMRKSLANGLN